MVTAVENKRKFTVGGHVFSGNAVSSHESLTDIQKTLPYNIVHYVALPSS